MMYSGIQSLVYIWVVGTYIHLYKGVEWQGIRNSMDESSLIFCSIKTVHKKV